LNQSTQNLSIFKNLTQNIVPNLSEIMVGSGIRKKPITDPGLGIKKASDPESGSATAEL